MAVKVAMINLPTNYGNHLPYGLMYLATWVNDRSNHKATVLDFMGRVKTGLFTPEFDEMSIAALKEQAPDLVGIPVFTPDFHLVVEYAKKIKAALDTKIVVGNVHAGLNPEDFFYEGSPFDYSIMGEGELTLVELLDALEVGADTETLKKIDGLAFSDSEEGFIKNGNRELIKDLSTLPMPDYSLFNLEPYLKTTVDLIRRVPTRGIGVYAGRGCPYKCIFCAANAIWKINDGKAVRFRGPQALADEVRHLKDNYGIDSFYFVDDTLTYKSDFVMEFCDLIEDLNLVWGCCGRVNETTDKLISKMKSAGCVQIDYGVESGSDTVLRTVRKGTTTEKILNAFDVCNRHGMRTWANMMVNLPGETEKDIDDTVALLRRIRPTRIATAIATPLPATDLYDKFLDEKIGKDEYEKFNTRRDQGDRFKFSEHSLGGKVAAKRVNEAIKYYIPDYISAFRNEIYVRNMRKQGRLVEHGIWALKFWAGEISYPVRYKTKLLGGKIIQRFRPLKREVA